jgi:predicted homoserine dehydrogenase-like protein
VGKNEKSDEGAGVKMNRKRIGIIGTGFMGRGMALAIERQPGLELSCVLTRRNLYHCSEYPFQEVLTNSVDELVEQCDLVVECSGDVLYGTEMIDIVMAAGLPVVTMNVDLQLTTGSYFASRGIITEIEGDQPGSLAALHENVMQMGFKPLVYGNVKGFLDVNPKRDDMIYWGNKQGISLDMVTSFTDGTKVQMEQALVANWFGIGIAQEGLLGLASETIETAAEPLALTAKRLGMPISEYILSRKAPPGVFIVAEHDPKMKQHLTYYKMGEGPYYTIVIPFHMCHLEGLKTIHRVLGGGGPLINNSTAPTISVAAKAKRSLLPGERIYKASGSFEFRGIAVRMEEHLDHVPIGLLSQAILKRPIDEGQIVRFDDVELPDSLAWRAWNETLSKRVSAQVS